MRGLGCFGKVGAGIVLAALCGCSGGGSGGTDGGASDGAPVDGGGADGAGSGGGPLFSDQVEVSVDAPHFVSAADLDGDGAPDLVAGRLVAEDAVAVSLGRGDGSFDAPISYGAGKFLLDLTVADLDGDATPDAVVSARESSDGTVEVFLGDGEGGLQAPVPSETEIIPAEIAVADFDGDGIEDVVFGEGAGEQQSVTYRPGEGDGTLGPPSHLPVGAQDPDAVAAADLDADGDQDVAAASFRDNVVVVFRGAGDGTFAEAARIPASNATSVRAGDLDADGLPDLVIKGAGTVFVARGLGDAEFAAPVRYSTETAFAGGLVLADFNADGHLDAAVNDGISDLVHVLPGAGDGTFGAARSFEAAGDPADVAAADFDADGRADLAVARSDEGAITVYLTGD